MTATLVGTLTETERDEIERINYRKMTLQTLFRSLSEEETPFNPHLYERMMDDMVQTRKKYDAWFGEKARQYGWKSVDGMSWSVDFKTCQVFLVDALRD